MVGVYAITNIINGKKYIGQSTNVFDRIAHHKSMLRHNRHENNYLQMAWNKYGENSFTFDVLEECKESELDEIEKRYIQVYNTMDRKLGYNFESGGSLNKHMSNESRKKMSDAKKGVFDGDKNPMYGVHLKLSDERKRNLSKRFSGSNNPMYGKHIELTKEQRQAISDRTKGANNPFYGKKHTEESKKKIKDSKKKTQVMCIETCTQYESANEAMRQTGIHSGSIIRATKHNLTAGGYHWKVVA